MPLLHSWHNHTINFILMSRWSWPRVKRLSRPRFQIKPVLCRTRFHPVAAINRLTRILSFTKGKRHKKSFKKKIWKKNRKCFFNCKKLKNKFSSPPDRRLFSSPSAPTLTSSNGLDEMLNYSDHSQSAIISSKYSDRDSGVNSQENLSDVMERDTPM